MTRSTGAAASAGTSTRRVRRATWASMVGSIADYYDYFLYGTAAALVLGPQYFPGSVGDGVVAAFASFAVGFFFRPVGSIVFGHFGDRLGRKKMLALTTLMMGGASTAIGLLPTYSAIGVAAPICLVALRAIQGFAVGGEWGGAALMAVETAPPGEKAYRGSVVMSGAFIGLLLANGMFFLFSSLLSDEAFRSWGWRVPFLFSVVILTVGYWIRRGSEDTPEFEAAKVQGKVKKVPLVSALRAHPKSFFMIVGMFISANVATYMVLTFAIAYGTKYAGLQYNTLLMSQTIAAACAVVTIPLVAKYADKKGFYRVYAVGGVLVIALSFPFFWSLDSGNIFLIVLATVGMLAFGAVSMVSIQQPIFTELFDTEFRYSGAGFSYQFGAAIAGVSPFISTYLVTLGGDSATYPALYLMGIGAITLITTVLVRQRIRDTYRIASGVPPAGGSVSETVRAGTSGR